MIGRYNRDLLHASGHLHHGSCHHCKALLDLQHFLTSPNLVQTFSTPPALLDTSGHSPPWPSPSWGLLCAAAFSTLRSFFTPQPSSAMATSALWPSSQLQHNHLMFRITCASAVQPGQALYNHLTFQPTCASTVQPGQVLHNPLTFRPTYASAVQPGQALYNHL